MITAYLNQMPLAAQAINSENRSLLLDAIWIDLLAPTEDEEVLVEQTLGLSIPTRYEMSEIELSSRLFKVNEILFMTVSMLSHSDLPEPKYDAVTFILTAKQLITLRYIEPHSFKMFTAQLQKLDSSHRNAVSFLIEILDATVQRIADILETIGSRLDDFSKVIFQPGENQHVVTKLDYMSLMQQIGVNANLNSKTDETLVMINRLLTFFNQHAETRLDNEGHGRITTLTKDIIALIDHANFLSNKINFLLDATLGMVNIEQNKIIKIFSVAAVIFLPPTLIASIYGMNFKIIPELSWPLGYGYAIAMMILSALLPYRYFKFRKWL
jgi:magnesium transporter